MPTISLHRIVTALSEIMSYTDCSFV